MTQKENEERMKDSKYKELEITTCNSGEDYVFISYRGSSWREMTKIVYRLQKDYNLRIYFDKEFASETNVWIDQFIDNMDHPNCKAFLCFFDEGYVTSYATLLELMHAMNRRSGLSKSIYAINFDIDWEWKRLNNSGDNTGLGKESHDNPAWERELNAFKREFKLLQKKKDYDTILEYFDPDDPGSRLRAGDCKKIMSILQPKNRREYPDSDVDEFYEQFIVNPLKKNCPSVFSDAPSEGQSKVSDVNETRGPEMSVEEANASGSENILNTNNTSDTYENEDDNKSENKSGSDTIEAAKVSGMLNENTTLKEFQQYCENIDFSLSLRKVRGDGKKQLFDYLMASLLRGCDESVSRNDENILRKAGYNYCTYAISKKLDLENPQIGASQYTWTSNARKALRTEDMPENYIKEDGSVRSGTLGENSKIFEQLDENMTIGEVLKKYELGEKGFVTKDNDGIKASWELIKSIGMSDKSGISELL